VRSSAADVLREIKPEAAEAASALIQALEDEDADVRSRAAWALGRIREASP
jgi:HEAT repeat protein